MIKKVEFTAYFGEMLPEEALTCVVSSNATRA